MEVLRQQPQLLERLMTRMARITEQLTEAVGDLLAQHDAATGAQAASDADAVAETLLMTCAGGIRAATKQWAATDSDISLDRIGTTSGLARSRSNRETDMSEPTNPCRSAGQIDGTDVGGHR